MPWIILSLFCMRPAVFFRLQLRIGLLNRAGLLTPDFLTYFGKNSQRWSRKGDPANLTLVCSDGSNSTVITGILTNRFALVPNRHVDVHERLLAEVVSGQFG